MNVNLSSPTRNDVALKAGVSSATVSRVYNTPDSVSAEKARRVLDAAKALGYEPNLQASSLRRNGSGIITLAAFRKKNRPYYWGNQPLLKWMYADIMRSVLDEVSSSMYQLQIRTMEKTEDLDSLKRSDGIIGYDIDTREEMDQLAETGRSCVICHHTEELEGLPAVTTDNRKGGALQALWLREQGVKRALYITGHTEEIPADRRRKEGFLEAFGEENVILVDDLSGLPEAEKRSREIRDIIQREKAGGMACVNDLTLLGIMTGSNEPFPENFRMIGYDAMPVLPLFSKTPATIDLRLNRIYRTGVKELIKQISGKSSEYDSRFNDENKIIIAPEIVD